MASEADDWKNPKFRQEFINTIEEAIRQWGNPTTRTASEMELYSFERANTKEDYLNYHFWLMSHIQGISEQKPKSASPVVDPSVAETNSQPNDSVQDDDWRSPGFRQNVITKIEGAIWISGNPTTKTASEMENHFFEKSISKEDYLSHLARLLVHIKQLSAQFQAFRQRAQVVPAVNVAALQGNIKPKSPSQPGVKEKAKGTSTGAVAVAQVNVQPKTVNQQDEWKTPGFRQNVIAKIGAVIRQSGNPTTKSASDMEFHFFQRSRNKEEYLNNLARLLVHIKGLTNVVVGNPADNEY
ncbi:mediator of RNA polymerase II transcription subunit 15-like [Daphnia carinata]|uniref:mediator of RNA polymerase II transcription subunit 15-like n=1 Tax=Daphnia carinata TaxID=120202 RepID=UPI00257EEC4C|nr:mediator of RNA polymerase II transcription subunit 15-like [Daphnia carinata]